MCGVRGAQCCAEAAAKRSCSASPGRTAAASGPAPLRAREQFSSQQQARKACCTFLRKRASTVRRVRAVQRSLHSASRHWTAGMRAGACARDALRPVQTRRPETVTLSCGIAAPALARARIASPMDSARGHASSPAHLGRFRTLQSTHGSLAPLLLVACGPVSRPLVLSAQGEARRTALNRATAFDSRDRLHARPARLPAVLEAAVAAA